MTKKYLTNIDDMRKWLKPLYRDGYIDSLSDRKIIELYNLSKDGLK